MFVLSVCRCGLASVHTRVNAASPHCRCPRPVSERPQVRSQRDRTGSFSSRRSCLGGGLHQTTDRAQSLRLETERCRSWLVQSHRPAAALWGFGSGFAFLIKTFSCIIENVSWHFLVVLFCDQFQTVRLSPCQQPCKAPHLLLFWSYEWECRDDFSIFSSKMSSLSWRWHQRKRLVT